MKKEKVAGNILFWLTLASPMISFYLAGTVGESNIFGIAGIVRCSWIMWLFIPIGILSIIIGIKLKNSRQKYKKFFVVSFICLPLLIIFGSYRFIFSDIVSYDTDKVIAVENEIGIELPERIEMATTKLSSYNVSYLKILDDESKERFENELSENPIWKKDLGSKIEKLLPFDIQCELKYFEYFIFYNITNNEYNVYPLDGEYKCIFIGYDYELQRLVILDDYKIVVN